MQLLTICRSFKKLLWCIVGAVHFYCNIATAVLQIIIGGSEKVIPNQNYMRPIKSENMFLGIGGVSAAELTSLVNIPTSADLSEIIKIVVQLAIGLVTIMGILKKKPPTTQL